MKRNNFSKVKKTYIFDLDQPINNQLNNVVITKNLIVMLAKAIKLINNMKQNNSRPILQKSFKLVKAVAITGDWFELLYYPEVLNKLSYGERVRNYMEKNLSFGDKSYEWSDVIKGNKRLPRIALGRGSKGYRFGNTRFNKNGASKFNAKIFINC